MGGRGQVVPRERRIVLDCTIDAERVEVAVPVLPEGEEPTDQELDLEYMCSIAGHLLDHAQDYGRAGARVEVLGVFYQSPTVPHRAPWLVTYCDAANVKRSVTTYADTAQGAFFQVLWFHASVVAPSHVAGRDAFVEALGGLTPILAQALPDFANRLVNNLLELAGTVGQMGAGVHAMPKATMLVPPPVSAGVPQVIAPRRGRTA